MDVDVLAFIAAVLGFPTALLMARASGWTARKVREPWGGVGELLFAVLQLGVGIGGILYLAHTGAL